jgi:DNA-binding MarR family transcriptional regulator
MTEKQSVIAEIIRAQHELQRSFAEDRTNPLFHSQLTMSQLKLMLMLHHSGGSGGQELARAMGVSLATLTGIVDRMVTQGLVTRREDPADRRVRRIELTAHGSRTTDGIVTAGTQRLHQMLDRIDPDGLDCIRRALHLMTDAARAQSPAPPAEATPEAPAEPPAGGRARPAKATRRP